jgi:hypothetical protein
MNAFIGLTVVTMLIGVGVAAYLLPTLVAVLRHAPDLAAVIVINVLLGWCVFGWVLAMVLAVRRATPSFQVIGQINGNMPVRPVEARRG